MSVLDTPTYSGIYILSPLKYKSRDSYKREMEFPPKSFLFQPGLQVKVCHVCYCNLVLNLSLLLQSNDDVIVTPTEGCCVLYSNLVFE